MILAIQDTTDLNFTHHPSKTLEKGFGPISSQAYVLGLKVHSILGVTAAGVPLGLLHQQVWARDAKKRKAKRRRQRQLKNKESKRWLTGLVATELSLPESPTVVTIADREADIYDLFALERRKNSHLLIRGTHNRRVNHETKYQKGRDRRESSLWSTSGRNPSSPRASNPSGNPDDSLCLFDNRASSQSSESFSIETDSADSSVSHGRESPPRC